MISPQQLKFEFMIANPTGVSAKNTSVTDNHLQPESKYFAVQPTVIDFNKALLKRKQEKEKNLYLQILESVKYIG